MPKAKAIVCTANNRPNSLKRMLSSLSKNNTDGYVLYIQVEPGNNGVLRIASRIDFMPTRVFENKVRLGVQDNPFELLFAVFETFAADEVVYLEDDLILSQDALSMANWFFDSEYSKYTECICSCFFRSESNLQLLPAMHSHFGSEKLIKAMARFGDGTRTGETCFTPHGIALTFDSWMKNFKLAWYSHRWGWDFGVRTMIANRDLYFLSPLVSRSANIGGAGERSNPIVHDRKFANMLHCRLNIPSSEFTVVDL